MLGVLCSGQGGQIPGMFDIFAGDGAALAVLDACEAALGTSLRDLAKSDGGAMFASRAAQPMICMFQAAVWASLRAQGVPAPRAVAGYSIGELSAYVVAGAINADDLAVLARARAEAMDAACERPGGMAAVRGLSRADLEPLCRAHRVEIAIANGFDRFIVGGEAAALAACAEEFGARGAHVTALPISVASHTSMMAPARADFEAALAGARLKRPDVPVLAGVDGLPVFDAARAAATLCTQIGQTIEWAACMDGMVEMGCTALLELGPGAGLAEMFRDRHPQLAVRSAAQFRTLAGVAQWAGRQG